MRFDDFNPKTKREGVSDIHERLVALMDVHIMFEGGEHDNETLSPEAWRQHYLESVIDAAVDNEWPFVLSVANLDDAESLEDLATALFNVWTGTLPLPDEADALAEDGYEEEAAMMSFEDPGVDVGTQYWGDIPTEVLGFLIDHSGINTNDLAQTFGVSRATLNNRRAGKGRGGISAQQYGGVADEMIDAVMRKTEEALKAMHTVRVHPEE